MSVERRLSAQARPLRLFLTMSVGLGTLTAVTVLLQARLPAGLGQQGVPAGTGNGIWTCSPTVRPPEAAPA